MKWKQPPIIKIYEALGTVVDARINVSHNSAKVMSSSGNKYYDVLYDEDKNAIMSNDNSSYWQGYIGYPAIALLLAVGALPYNADMASLLKGIAWKDVNQRFKNDFEKTLEYIESSLDEIQKKDLSVYVLEVA
jgi:hypothetical protein